MPISATGSKRTHGRAGGFSLVELMVTLVIVGITASVVVLAMPASDDALRDEAEAFAGIAERTVQASILSGRTLGLRLTEDGFDLLQYRRGIWSPYADGKALAGGAWQDGTVVALDRPGADKAARDETRRDRTRESDGEAAPLVPDIWVDPIGMVTPFDVIFTRGLEEVVVTGDATGSVTIRGPQTGT